jgi:hypothetical protein
MSSTGEIGTVLDCDCTLCQKRGGSAAFHSRKRFHHEYAARKSRQLQIQQACDRSSFLPDCGVSPFSEGTDPKGNKMVAINMRCVEDVDPARWTSKIFNGRAVNCAPTPLDKSPRTRPRRDAHRAFGRVFRPGT